MITGLEHQDTSVEAADACISGPSGKNEWASLSDVI